MNFDLSGLKIGEELFKGALTLASVYIGGLWAFKAAQRGRREELLFNARFKAFDELSSYLYGLQLKSMIISVNIQRLPQFIKNDEPILRNELQSQLNDLHAGIFSHADYRKHLLYMSDRRTEEINSILSEYTRLIFACQDYNRDIYELTESGNVENIAGEIVRDINTANSQNAILIQAMYDEQEFPRKKTPKRRQNA